MEMRKKLSLLIVLFVLWQFIPLSALASNDLTTSIREKEAIEIVKKLFDTSDFSDFTINFSQANNQNNWYLSWNKNQEPYKNLSATIDSLTGNILNLYYYNASKYPTQFTLPKVSKEEGEKIARAYAEKLLPQFFAETKLQSNQEGYYPQPLITTSYNFYFQRYYRGIPVETNGFYINVNAYSGNVESFNFTWNHEPLPEPNEIITLTQAEKIYSENYGLKLKYQQYLNYLKKENKLKLIYAIEKPYISIDAFTGKIIENGYYGPYYGGSEGVKGKEQNPLTEIEDKEVKAFDNLLKKEEGIAALTKFFPIPSSFQLRSSNLNDDYINPGHKVWEFNWFLPITNKENKGEYQAEYSIYARVAADTGRILQYSYYDPNFYQQEGKAKFKRTESQKIAENFLAKIEPELFGQIKLQDRFETDDPNLREHFFQYNRYYNGIPFEQNNIYITINALNGEVINYQLNWQDYKFPDPTGVINKIEAEKEFFLKSGLELKYAPVYDAPTGLAPYKLIYQLKALPSYNFDAFTMQNLDWEGNPIVEKKKSELTDISGSWAEKEIKTLFDLGIIEVEGDKYRPNQFITQDEFLQLLLNIENPHNGLPIVPVRLGAKAENNGKTPDYIEQSYQRGILKEKDYLPNQTLTREKAAVYLVRFLGYEKIASLKDLYQLNLKDKKEITPEYQGHIAIAMGLKILYGSNGNFMPKEELTRAQAAVIIVRMLSEK